MTKKLSRLGLFVFYDPQGIVDDYVVHLLHALRPHFARLLVISNGEVNHVAKERLLQHADDVFVRENYGLDAGAFKDGLINFCGWDEVEKYDEVVLINDTFFGPIGSFDDMFSEMANRDLDFWGMSAGYKSVDGWNRVVYGYIPEHIQTFFVAFRQKMVCSDAFHLYWNNYDSTINDFVSVVTRHEVVMTKHFQDLGFQWDIYADTQRYRAKRSSENFNLYHYHAHTLMRDMKFPILKRKALIANPADQLCMQDLESASDALDYIRTQTDYDPALIWENVLRLYNITDLFYSLHLNYVFPSVPVELPKNRRAALVYRVGNPFFAEQFCKNAAEICKLIDVYFIPEDKESVQIIHEFSKENSKMNVLEPTNQKTEMGSFVLRCKELAQQYDYLGFLHDGKNPEHSSTTIMESSVYGHLQNIAHDPAYISQILNFFDQDSNLGILGVPFSVHNFGFENYGNAWNDSFDVATKLVRQFGFNCSLAEDKQPFITVGCFWCRTAAIQSIWDQAWSISQFHINPVTNISKTNEALIRILPYAAQNAKFYSGIVMHTNYASMRITTQQYMLHQIVNVTKGQFGCSSPRYKGYIEQLQSISSNHPDSALTIDISHFSMSEIIRIYLDRKAPPWFTKFAQKTYRFLKALFHLK